ncbi:MAG: FAD-dependent oxidoreductase [Chloroflexota bacterium]
MSRGPTQRGRPGRGHRAAGRTRRPRRGALGHRRLRGRARHPRGVGGRPVLAHPRVRRGRDGGRRDGAARVAVSRLQVDARGVGVGLADGRWIDAAQVIDAAGLGADEVARLAGDGSFRITPRRGQFLVSEETFGVDRIVLPVPGPMGKGMLVTPIVFGGLLLGPTAVDIADKSDRGVRPDETRRIVESCGSLVPAVAEALPVRSFVGLRTVSSTGDHILGPSRVGDRLWLACGIRSTGISVSPAVAEHVADGVLQARGWASRPRRIAPPPLDLAEMPGPVACLCRGVSQGELVGACRRPLGPRTLDSLKRRGGATFGDCQGNLCGVAVAGILAAELGVPVTDIEKGPAGSWLLAEAHAGPPGSNPVAPPLPDGPLDLVVVGLGHAGSALVGAARDAGLRVAGVDRGAGRTVTGLVPRADGWEVEVDGPSGAGVLRARAVAIATGGYVTPREQRAIAGPRPAGVITSDLVAAATAEGWVPGRRAVVVGAGDLAARTADALEAAGVAVVARLADEPLEVRGTARLDGIRTPNGWVDADTLVLADRLRPQPFLLRGLGLVDGRPGTPAPADADGRVGPRGLWAVGCCVDADADHRACAIEGDRVGAAIARDLLEVHQ